MHIVRHIHHIDYDRKICCHLNAGLRKRDCIPYLLVYFGFGNARAGMERDDRSHFLIYQVLGVAEDEGKLIDVYQNKGRFLYKYAGSFVGPR